jgi:outer membrane protein TolC
MHKIVCLFISVTLCCGLSAQIRPGVMRSRINSDTSRYADIREKLVQLAMQNPEFEIADRNVSIAHYQLKAAKGDWLSFIQPSINLNTSTIAPLLNQTEQLYFPLWNIGVALPLNFYSQRKNGVKVAKERIFIAEAEKNERYRRIRMQVLSAFEDYRMYRDMLDIQNTLMLDERLDYMQAEKDFADGELDATMFKKAKLTYAEAQMKQREMQRNVETSKLILEQMIGVSIDEVLGKL